MNTPPLFSATRIAEILSEPAQRVLTPTPEQRRMIEQPLDRSVLVVAGAGSGKTETMANRVVWLVANGHAAPNEILGLTFTRKAAGELNERIAGRLSRFTEQVLDHRERGLLSHAECRRADELERLLNDGLALPEVSTYNSFAAGIVEEFGAFAGIASSSALIDEAAAWRLARSVVAGSHDPELITSGDSLGTLVKRTLSLDHAVSDNLTSFGRVEQVVHEFLRIGALPRDEKSRGTPQEGVLFANVRSILEAVEGTLLIARLAREYAAEKHRRGVIEFSDQLRLAIQTIDAFPTAVTVLRERTPIVLLDEVQDTSVAQTRLLSKLFRGQSVMAVGDPNQSIYGWRGASADNLSSFHRDFNAPGVQRKTTLSLSVSWRNPSAVLHAANVVAEPLNDSSPFAVPRLQSREEYLQVAPKSEEEHADGGPTIETRFVETMSAEFDALARWMRDERTQYERRTGQQATAAVIFRRRSVMPSVADALDRYGVPSRIVGVGGLLSTPEVTDLESTLRCLWYPDAGSELIRILAGPRFRVGVADINGLRTCAQWFSHRDVSQRPLSDQERQQNGPLRDPDREFTLLDALNEIASMKHLDHPSLSTISPVGRERLQEAGRMLMSLRQAVSGGILDLIRMTIEALRLDIELEANERGRHNGSAVARANLDAFHELVEGFLSTDVQGTLASVLAWLERVREIDQEAEHVPEPEPGTVQLITVHGAKGLEWDLVAIPRMVDEEFPLPGKEGKGWLRAGELPDELRGDANARPQLHWRLATTQQEFREELGGIPKSRNGERWVTEGYVTELAAQHLQEERRLAYVAITRAAKKLLMTGSFWGGQKEERPPSPYLRELAQHGLIPPLPEQSMHEKDPVDGPDRVETWPLDPLGERRAEVLEAAGRVIDRLRQSDDHVERTIDPTVELLLAERRATREDGALVADQLPPRVTASAFHEFIEAPQRAYQQTMRPLPQRPYRRTRTGNRFHEWVERRTSTVKGTELPLFALAAPHEGLGAEDLDHTDLEDAADLETLIEKFNRSRWAGRQPVVVEQEITLPFAGRRLVCKLDAVYRTETDGSIHYEIVDWKTGRPPHGESERESRFFQLDLYRHAYAMWAGVDEKDITATLFYVAHEVELQSTRTRSFEELEQLWLAATAELHG